MTPSEGSQGVAGTEGAGDPLDPADTVLQSIAALPLERHPQAFARFDELLREALESPPHVSSG